MVRTNKKVQKLLPVIAVAAVVIIALSALGISRVVKSAADNREVITVSTLERIINASELSTFTAVYNGIAQVMNEEEPDKIDYYVSYEAKVNAGIDFDAILIEMDPDEKAIHITVPEVHITNTSVDVASLDYIFMNEKANTSAVSQEAFKACEADVKQESEQQEAIFELAEQNAKNILSALITPFVEQLDAEYELTIG